MSSSSCLCDVGALSLNQTYAISALILSLPLSFVKITKPIILLLNIYFSRIPKVFMSFLAFIGANIAWVVYIAVFTSKYTYNTNCDQFTPWVASNCDLPWLDAIKIATDLSQNKSLP